MAKFTEVKDSGKREEMSTGSVRDSQEGKPRFDLISPLALRRLAMHYANGATKYGEWNWTKGQKSSRYLASALRHVYDYLDGDKSEDHITAVAWNIFAIIHNEEAIEKGILPRELHDIPHESLKPKQ